MSIVETLSAVIEEKTYVYQVKNYNVKGGITHGGTDGALFELNGHIPVVCKYEDEYVKRVCLPMNLAHKFITKGSNELDIFLEELIDTFVEETGCKNLTLKSPMGDYCRLMENNKEIEIRVYGLKEMSLSKPLYEDK